MAHPFASHRSDAVSKKRVGHLMKSGGQPHSDVAADKKLFKELMAKHEAEEMKAEGKKSGGRLDKYARGGRTKHKPSHQVNIAIVAPHGRHPTEGAAPGGPLPMPPPRPPLGAAPGLPPGLPPGGPPVAGGPPGLPPGLRPPGMMKRGGAVKKFARGGKLGMTAGAETGKGRKQKIRAYGLKPAKG